MSETGLEARDVSNAEVDPSLRVLLGGMHRRGLQCKKVEVEEEERA